MENWIELANALGNSEATQNTVSLFNSCLVVKKNEKGKYLLVAVRPFKNGVITEKQYLDKV